MKQKADVCRRYSANIFSFHEILEAWPGRGFKTKDVLTDRVDGIVEKQGSLGAKPGYLLFGKTVTIQGLTTLEAAAPIMIPPILKIQVLELRKYLNKQNPMITRKTLWDYDSEIQNVYQTIYDAVMNPQMPSLHNTEGDPLVPHQLTYELLVSPGDAFDGLADLNCSESRVQILEQGECNSGVLRRIAFSWSKKGNSKHAGMDNTVLGQIEIDGPKMVVNVNSAERAEEFEILLKTRLEGKYKAKPRFIESIEHGLMNRPVSSASGRSEHDELMKHPEVQAKIAQMMKAHGMIGSINRFLRSVTRRRLRPQSPARLERNLVPSLSNLKLKPNCDLNRAQAQNFSKRSEINLVC